MNKNIPNWHINCKGVIFMSDTSHNRNIFETFIIEDKIEVLKGEFVMKNMDLQDKRVVIALPAFDESMRSIYTEDRVLYDVQQRDADVQARHIMTDTGAELVSIVTGFDKVNDLARNVTDPYECLIFLHEFMSFESIAILSTLTKYNKNLKYFEIH